MNVLYVFICLNIYLRVLLIVQWLGVGVMLADKRINQQQEQHVEQQCAHNRQVNDDGYLKQTGWKTLSNTYIICSYNAGINLQQQLVFNRTSQYN